MVAVRRRLLSILDLESMAEIAREVKRFSILVRHCEEIDGEGIGTLGQRKGLFPILDCWPVSQTETDLFIVSKAFENIPCIIMCQV